MNSSVMFVGSLLLMLQILLLVFNIRRKKWWGVTFAFEGLSLLAAVVAAVVFDRLPGYGFMPGMTYFAEWMISVGALLIYGMMLVVTAIFCGEKRKAPKRVSRRNNHFALVLRLVGFCSILIGYVAEVMLLWGVGLILILSGMSVGFTTNRCPNCGKIFRGIYPGKMQAKHCVHCGKRIQFDDEKEE